MATHVAGGDLTKMSFAEFLWVICRSTYILIVTTFTNLNYFKGGLILFLFAEIRRFFRFLIVMLDTRASNTLITYTSSPTEHVYIVHDHHRNISLEESFNTCKAARNLALLLSHDSSLICPKRSAEHYFVGLCWATDLHYQVLYM